jgi:hypothetical protein
MATFTVPGPIERFYCGHIDPSGHDRGCECTACDLCDWPSDDLFRVVTGELVCQDCLDGEDD